MLTVRIGPTDEEEARDFQVHAPILMLTSPVFERMLSYDMIEKASGQISLPGKSPTEFEELLKLLNPPGCRKAKLTAESAMKMLSWADEYAMLWLKDECETKLLKMPMSPELLATASKFQLPTLRAHLIESLIESPDASLDWSSCVEDHKLLEDLFRASIAQNSKDKNEIKDMRDKVESMTDNLMFALKTELQDWPRKMYNALPASTNDGKRVDKEAKQWLQKEVDKLLL